MNHQETAPNLILASASPRRSEILKQIGIKHTILPTDIPEVPAQGETPKSYVARIASEKSLAAQTLSGKSKAVLAADTEVIIDDLILGKPSSLTDAISMLTRLSGRTHQVITAVSLRYLNHHWSSLSISEVKFRDIHPSEIETYWASGEPRDKAGAYAIQGLGSVFVQNMEGSFSGIVGLPIYETSILLDKVGIRPPFLTERP